MNGPVCEETSGPTGAPIAGTDEAGVGYVYGSPSKLVLAIVCNGCTLMRQPVHKRFSVIIVEQILETMARNDEHA